MNEGLAVKEEAIATQVCSNLPKGDTHFYIRILNDSYKEIDKVFFTPEEEIRTPIYRAIRLLANCSPNPDNYEGARKVRFNAIWNRWGHDFAWFLQKELHLWSRQDPPFRYTYMRAVESRADLYLAFLDVCKFIDNEVPQEQEVSENAWVKWLNVMIEVRLGSFETVDDNRNREEHVKDLEKTLKALRMKNNPYAADVVTQPNLFNLYELAINLANPLKAKGKKAQQMK